MARTAQPAYIDTPRGGLFGLFHAPHGEACKGLVLHLPPFAEEMNACRRVSAQAARSMASQGWAVCQFDPSGCGDSGGDFADARWAHWIDDAQRVLQHGLRWQALDARTPIWLWGVRSGALMAAQLQARLEIAHPIHHLWWQPVLLGRQVLQQWLRLHSAQAWLGHADTSAPAPGELLAQGQSVVVGGYPISPDLARDLDSATAAPSTSGTGMLHWLDTQLAPEPTPAAERGVQSWATAGWRVRWQAVQGPTFWQSIGQDDAPQLVTCSTQVLGATLP